WVSFQRVDFVEGSLRASQIPINHQLLSMGVRPFKDEGTRFRRELSSAFSPLGGAGGASGQSSPEHWPVSGCLNRSICCSVRSPLDCSRKAGRANLIRFPQSSGLVAPSFFASLLMRSHWSFAIFNSLSVVSLSSFSDVAKVLTLCRASV